MIVAIIVAYLHCFLQLTWADLGLVIFVERLGVKQADDVLGKFEKLSALYKRLAEHPKIASWIASTSQTPISPGFVLH